MRDLTAEEWAEVRAAVALPGWRWMTGMLARRLAGPAAGGYRYGNGDIREAVRHAQGLPDPRDPATAGCLLALLGGYRATRKTSAGVWRVDTNGVVELCASDLLGLAVIRCALDRGRWGA